MISININDTLLDDDSRVASAFNEFFSSIAQNLQDNIPDYGQKPISNRQTINEIDYNPGQGP